MVDICFLSKREADFMDHHLLGGKLLNLVNTTIELRWGFFLIKKTDARTTEDEKKRSYLIVWTFAHTVIIGMSFPIMSASKMLGIW